MTEADPALLSTAIRRGLEASSPAARLGYLELGAKLQKEIGPQPDQGATVTVIVVGAGAEAIAAWREAAARIAEGRAAIELEAGSGDDEGQDSLQPG